MTLFSAAIRQNYYYYYYYLQMKILGCAQGTSCTQWFCTLQPRFSSLPKAALCVQGDRLKQKASTSLTAAYRSSVRVFMKIRGACLKCMIAVESIPPMSPSHTLHFKLLVWQWVAMGRCMQESLTKLCTPFSLPLEFTTTVFLFFFFSL